MITINMKEAKISPKISMVRKYCLAVKIRLYLLSMQVGSLSAAAKIMSKMSNGSWIKNANTNGAYILVKLLFSLWLKVNSLSYEALLERILLFYCRKLGAGWMLIFWCCWLTAAWSKLIFALQKGHIKAYKLPTHCAQIEWRLEQIIVGGFCDGL